MTAFLQGVEPGDDSIHRLPKPVLPVDFAHDSERRIAELFDFYGIAWEYEPTTFVLDAAPDGSLLSAFTPDFYLPDHDLFVEVTTLRQTLVTRKNKKVRRLRELHPDIQVRVLYRSDLERMFAKHAA
ncbi:MAG: hypothetical protein HOA26_05590 [Actinobacteria bacterium]|nr:hypothetical protein [Actinomycetota bacterium]MBT4786050.1 hypothetical protein [Actinomycetota bacterium]MBT5040948.1 hypothetical protein [Actinomycetota bacterium]MBT6648161.1 hypothetical protein [Actinomycetota bacterium]MBT6872693.1 hypothetical protein [Actinomycetota bacterium]